MPRLSAWRRRLNGEPAGNRQEGAAGCRPKQPFNHPAFFGSFLPLTGHLKQLWEAREIQTVDQGATAIYRGANKSGIPDRCRQFMRRGTDQS